MIETNLYEYLERISNLIQSEKHYVSSTTDLTPVQILTLNYLSRCNRFSDTNSALALFLDESASKLDQSIDSLAENCFLSKVTDQADPEAVRLVLTAKGQQAVSEIVVLLRDSTFSVFDKVGTEGTEDYLSDLLIQLQVANKNKSFGQCQTCAHFIKESDHSFKCGLTQGALDSDDIVKICQEHA